MYPDPKRIKDNRITIRLDDYEHALVQALANYQGEQVATLLRRMALQEAVNQLGVEESIHKVRP